MKPRRDKRALEDAWKALLLIDNPIGEGLRGDLEGADTVDLGMEAMATALARLFAFPEAQGQLALDLPEVLAYLVRKRVAEAGFPRIARTLSARLRRASYVGLTSSDMRAAEAERSKLYDHLTHILSEAENDLRGG